MTGPTIKIDDTAMRNALRAHRAENDARLDKMQKTINNLIVWYVCGAFLGLTGTGLALIALTR
jgi:hypothetical protein